MLGSCAHAISKLCFDVPLMIWLWCLDYKHSDKNIDILFRVV